MAFAAIENFKKRIDSTKLRVVSTARMVWVFGGGSRVGDPNPHQSNRHVFLTKVHAGKSELADLIRIPEQYPEWNSYNGYPDLLQFERDAAYLANQIVLFCESAGAIAELGTFAADEILAAKTIVVISSKHLADGSYVRLGPITRIREIDESAICVIDANTPKDFESEVHLVIQASEEKLIRAHQKTALVPSHTRDTYLLAVDLVDLFHALTRPELLDLLQFFNVAIGIDHFRRMVTQLLLFGLLRERHVGSAHYLIPGLESEPCIDYTTSVAMVSFDRMGFKVESHEAMQADKKRHKGTPKEAESK